MDGCKPLAAGRFVYGHNFLKPFEFTTMWASAQVGVMMGSWGGREEVKGGSWGGHGGVIGGPWGVYGGGAPPLPCAVCVSSTPKDPTRVDPQRSSSLITSRPMMI